MPSVPLPCSGFPGAWATLRLLAGQGTPVALSGLDQLAPQEADRLVDFFLHDPDVTGPIEPFATLLGTMLRKEELVLWDLCPPESGPEGGIDRFLLALPQAQPDCMSCACFSICMGYAAWAGSCPTWRSILTRIAAAARELARLNRSSQRSSNGLP